MNKRLDEAFKKTSAKLQEREEKLAALSVEEDSIKDKLENLEKEISAAVNGENYTAYSAAKRKKEEAQFNLAVIEKNKKMMEELPKVSDYKKEWEDFIRTYEAEFTPELKAYNKMREDLYQKYLYLVDMQSKATAIRKKIADICGVERPIYIPADSTAYQSIGTFTCLPDKAIRITTMRHSPDVNFFVAYDYCPEELERELYETVVMRA